MKVHKSPFGENPQLNIRISPMAACVTNGSTDVWFEGEKAIYKLCIWLGKNKLGGFVKNIDAVTPDFQQIAFGR